MFLRNLAILQALQQPLQSTISLFSVSLESTFPSCATLGIRLYLIPSHSRDTQTHINFPNPCWIKSAHRYAFVLTFTQTLLSFVPSTYRPSINISTAKTLLNQLCPHFLCITFKYFPSCVTLGIFPSSFHSHNRDIQTFINLVQILLICTRPCAIPCTLSHPTLFS